LRAKNLRRTSLSCGLIILTLTVSAVGQTRIEQRLHTSAWLADFEQLRDELASHYSTLERQLQARKMEPLQEQPAALHFVVDRQRIFMASTQATTTEYWITDDKTYEKRGARVTIIRKDLGVRWVINTQNATYSETRLTSPAKNQTRVEDIHTAGFNYEPEFAWAVADSAEASTIDGRACRLTVATGTDDFADMTLKLWLCHTDRPALERKANGFVLESAGFGNQNPVTFATELLSKRPDVLLMSLEATVEPPISSTMTYRVVVRTIENALPPAGIFDLPAGIQKTP